MSSRPRPKASSRVPPQRASRRSPFRIGLVGVVAAVIVALAIVGRLDRHTESPQAAVQAGRVACQSVAKAFSTKSTGEWITMSGKVSRLLPDSFGTSTHQRFILKCTTSQTVLIDNNVDVGQRVPVRIGERVIVHGQYFWNDLGGGIHDTHHSTDSNPDGWIYAAGKVYE